MKRARSAITEASKGIRGIIAASTTGEIEVKAGQMFKGFDIVVVTYHV